MVLVFLCSTLCHSKCCSNLAEEVRVSCMTVSVLWLFLMVRRVGLQYVIVAFPGHSHLLVLPKSHYLSRDM